MKRNSRARFKTQDRRKTSNRTGAVLVEFAMVIPIFLLIVFTCIEFCRLNMIRNLVQDAAYYASRQCIVPGATSAEAQAEANRILSFMGTRGAIIVINNGAALTESSNEVSVQITVPIAQNALFAPRFITYPNFQATARMRTERYEGFYDGGS
jgi:Flp pilus assembly protein TadG